MLATMSFKLAFSYSTALNLFRRYLRALELYRQQQQLHGLGPRQRHPQTEEEAKQINETLLIFYFHISRT